MIPSKKCDRAATFQKIARVKSWVIEMEGNLGMAQATGRFLY
jgi:hypothetical protein